MLERVITKPEVVEVGKVGAVESADKLLEVGVVEDLTRQGRVPHLAGGCMREEEMYFVFIPPVGVSFGDKAWFYPGGGIEYFVAGESVGSAELYTLSKIQGEQILERTDNVLQKIGRAGTYIYDELGDDDVYRAEDGKHKIKPEVIAEFLANPSQVEPFHSTRPHDFIEE